MPVNNSPEGFSLPRSLFCITKQLKFSEVQNWFASVRTLTVGYLLELAQCYLFWSPDLIGVNRFECMPSNQMQTIHQNRALDIFFFELWPEQMINAVFETADAIEKPYNKISVAIFFP